jgi:hypothetical protein
MTALAHAPSPARSCGPLRAGASFVQQTRALAHFPSQDSLGSGRCAALRVISRPEKERASARRCSCIRMSLFNPQHRRAVRVLDLKPTLRTARAVGQIATLGHDALKAHFAGVLEDDRAFTVEVLVKMDAAASAAEELPNEGRSQRNSVAVSFHRHVQTCLGHPKVVAAGLNIPDCGRLCALCSPNCVRTIRQNATLVGR